MGVWMCFHFLAICFSWYPFCARLYAGTAGLELTLYGPFPLPLGKLSI